jgi:hypothetical protein
MIRLSAWRRKASEHTRWVWCSRAGQSGLADMTDMGCVGLRRPLTLAGFGFRPVQCLR